VLNLQSELDRARTEAAENQKSFSITRCDLEQRLVSAEEEKDNVSNDLEVAKQEREKRNLTIKRANSACVCVCLL
jgi:hypothetical protein